MNTKLGRWWLVKVSKLREGVSKKNSSLKKPQNKKRCKALQAIDKMKK